MRTCLKCQKHFPVCVRINGEVKNLGSRKYCLECSPFNRHNTRPIHTNIDACPICGSMTKKGRPNRRMCYSCENKREEKYKLDKVKEIVGESCWICGYDKGFEMLDFHHVRDKNFLLTRRNIGRSGWEDILSEIKKCALLCCRCHREHHAGYLPDDFVKDTYEKKWKEIEQATRKTANPPP